MGVPVRVVITQNITLDGVIDQNEETGDWFTTADGAADPADLQKAFQHMMAEEDAQLYGRGTFEAMRGFWPLQDGDSTGVTNHLNQVHKYVFSTTLEDPQWENSTVLHGDLIEEVSSLKGRPGGNLGITGSVSICHTLINAGLVDEYRLLLHPAVVGAGRRLFGDETIESRDLTLIEARPFASGVVLLRYQPVCPGQTDAGTVGIHDGG